MHIIRNSKIYIAISAFLVGVSIIALASVGIPLGIDFSGGGVIEGTFATPQTQDIFQSTIADLGIETRATLDTAGTMFTVEMPPLTQDQYQQITGALSSMGQYVVTAETTVGPSVGKELTKKAYVAIILVSLTMIAFIAYAFRAISEVASSWRFGLVAIVTLLHDIALTTGVYVVLAHTADAKLDTLFVVALLTVLGLSINDTIVIFDRIRENLLNNKAEDKKESFAQVVGRSIDQTKMRSFNTSFAVIIVLVALVILGPDSTRLFSITLASGMIFGTYSSIFLASPLLVLWNSQPEQQNN